ncbi:MAG: hypothetical protein HOC23_19795, partial [Halieaceae bacterium]|nr:hypothetical protein [Halieaceae bacterium]
IERAQQSLNKATELGHAWSVTPTLIDAAEAELAARRPDAALVAAQRALVTANAAIAQAKSEQSAWQARVPSQQP